MKKDNFLISEQWGVMFKALPDEKAGQLIKAIYEVRENPDYEIDDPVLAAVFEMIKNYITENERKYQEKCEKLAENGKQKKKAESDSKQKGAIDSNCFKEESNENKSKHIESDKSYSLSLSVKDIIDYLNLKTGKSYKPNTKATRKHISARLSEGFTVDDFKRVIDYKTSQWLNDPKMSDYLRPETLFCEKFESYLQSAPRSTPTIDRPPDIPDKYADYEKVTFDDD